MTPFQKLFWLFQMGVHSVCGEKVQNRMCSHQTLQQSKQKLENSGMALEKTALHSMVGTGCSTPRIICVLEARSSQKDRTGEYLSGPEGELTRKMLASIGLDLQKNTYLTYLSPWRPPGNRMLTNMEISQCLEFLKQRIESLHPQFLLLLGVPVVRALLDGKTLSQVRLGREKYAEIPVFGTFSPSWLIKHPDYRRAVWEDLKKFKQIIEKS